MTFSASAAIAQVVVLGILVLIVYGLYRVGKGKNR